MKLLIEASTSSLSGLGLHRTLAVLCDASLTLVPSTSGVGRLKLSLKPKCSIPNLEWAVQQTQPANPTIWANPKSPFGLRLSSATRKGSSVIYKVQTALMSCRCGTNNDFIYPIWRKTLFCPFSTVWGVQLKLIGL